MNVWKATPSEVCFYNSYGGFAGDEGSNGQSGEVTAHQMTSLRTNLIEYRKLFKQVAAGCSVMVT
jgi:hypothetical protein